MASARVVTLVHGRNGGMPSPQDVRDYWHQGETGDGVLGFTGRNTEGNYTYGYDAAQAWNDLSGDNMPVCMLTHALLYTPGTDIAVLAHSSGAPIIAYMMAVAQNGWPSSCTVSPATARAWVTYVSTVAAPFRGTEVADAVYFHDAADPFHALCGNIGTAIYNIFSDSSSPMTYALQTSYMANWFSKMSSYGSFDFYLNGGLTADGDDSNSLSVMQWCTGIESPNDGVISQNSALGCARGSAPGTVCMPHGHASWFDKVSHSSNRRDDYLVFASNVWSTNPY